MSTTSSYQTLNAPCEAIFKDRKSKFIAYAYPCDNVEDVQRYLTQLRSEHHTARHFCYAYIFGIDKTDYRANDDGEPSNSAGQPILGQIQAFDLTNVLIVVVRYFGGVKLGVGGLMNAYKTAAKEAIEAGEIITTELYQHFRLKFEYESFSPIQVILNQLNIEAYRHQLEASCEIDIKLKPEEVANFQAKLENIQLTIEDLGIK